jgi:hypothetical protein
MVKKKDRNNMHSFVEQKSIIAQGIPPVVIFEDRAIDHNVLETLRPSADILATNRVTLARYNDVVRRTNFSLEGMNLDNLVSSALPFVPLLFHLAPHNAGSSSAMED